MAIPNSIDKSARLEMPTHVKRPADGPAETPIQAKKMRMEPGATPLATPSAAPPLTPQVDVGDGGGAATQQQLKDRFMAKLNEPRGDKLSSINRVDIK